MESKIAVIFDEEQAVSTFENGDYIGLFEKDEDGWALTAEIPFSIEFGKGLPAARGQIRRIIGELGGCGIIAGKTIGGLPYNELNKMNFRIFELEELLPDTLDSILSDISEIERESKSAEAVGPVETGLAGAYFIDLIEIQAKHPETSSKKALLPFLETVKFHQLKVLCSHTPPWFENYLPQHGFLHRAETLENGKTQVIILPKTCGES